MGAGVQGRHHLVALKEVLPRLEEVKVFDINREAAGRYRDDLAPRTGVRITICDDVETVAKGSDVIVTATQRLAKPLIRNEWFEKGCLGFGIEASRGWYGDAILKADKFITDDWNQTQYYHAQGAFPDGLPDRYIEIGSIVIGKNRGRETGDERILAMNIGLALEDIILAHRIYEIARESGGYQKVMLMEV